jgi:hypothetical protein
MKTVAARRELRKALGPRAAAMVVETTYDFQMFVRRGFWRRLAWLLFGR